MSNYRELIDLTSDTLAVRTQHYRLLVVTFGAIGLINLCALALTMSPRTATGLFFLFPVYGLFLFFDNRSLNVWRAKILDAWKTKEVDLFALREALATNKALLPETLNGMLETLPELSDLVEEQSVSSGTRKALAVLLMARDQDTNNKLLCRAGEYFFITVATTSAVVSQRWEPLFLIILAPLVRVLCRLRNKRNLSTAMQESMQYQKAGDFDPVVYRRTATALACNSCTSEFKECFTDFIGST